VARDTTDVAVVGGGAIGLACAWRIAQRGPSVSLIDDSVGRGASHAAAGMLAPVTEVHYGEEALLRLNLESARRYPSFAEELEQASDSTIGYRRCGTLVVARDADDNAALQELYRFQTGLGLSAQRLTSRECKQLEPALSPRVRGGILVEGDHQVDNRALLQALKQACIRQAVRFVPARAARVDTTSDRVVGVTLADGATIRCEQLVLAAGVWSASLDGVPADARPPLRPVKGQLLHLRLPRGPSSAAALSGRNLRGTDVYLVVRSDGRVVIGATTEEQGSDTTVTAGGVFGLLRAAYELVPATSELELTEVTAGLRPATPDNAPLVGSSGITGLVLATGHYRNGILLTPITAEVIADVIATGKDPDIVEAFSPRRFDASSHHGALLT
jgi:glycine oxidase